MSVNKKAFNDEMQQRGGYAIVPNEIWERKDLDRTAKVIWCYILSRKANWQSSRNNISKNLHIHHATVTKYIAQLESLGLLKKTVGANSSWDFEIIQPSQWLPEPGNTKLAQYIPHTTSDTSSVLPVVHPVDHTQEYNTNNTSSLASKRSEKRGSSLKKEKVQSSPMSKKISPPKTNSIAADPKTTCPEYLNKASAWYQHYLKSGINESTFNSLPEEIKSGLYAQTQKLVSGVRMNNGRISDASDAKDQFVSTLEAYRQKQSPTAIQDEDDIKFDL
ncbi:hypothetical protein ACES2J_08250 [Bdellovibrio bacteriovorus]|uniref:hypothetical protein n=1 Tax=Bdellovibrio bacteriovorus TaxID=959 RepID=UPI0035A5B518